MSQWYSQHIRLTNALKINREDRIKMTASILRWSARIFAGLVAAFLAMMAFGQGGPPNPFSQNAKVAAELIAMYIMWCGLLIGWKWELAASILVIGSFSAFMIIEGKFIFNFGYGPIIIVGLLYLASGLLKRRQIANRDIVVDVSDSIEQLHEG
jgi:hypothetical protein